MYRVMNVEVSMKSEALYSWCVNVSKLANNLYNAALFRERQLISALRKPYAQWTDNEKAVVQEIDSVRPLMKPNRKIENSGMMDFYFMTEYLQKTENPDYRAHIPRHTAHGVLKHVVRDLKSFFAAMKSYKQNPAVFTGRPQLPKYKRKGGMCSFDVSNQECVIKEDKERKIYAKS